MTGADSWYRSAEREGRLVGVAGAMCLVTLLSAFLLLMHLTRTVPQPPPIQFVEVNFGTDAIGSGTLQTRNAPSNRPEPDEAGSPRAASRLEPVERSVRPKPVVEEVERPVTKRVTEARPDITSRVESPVEAPERPPVTKPAPAPPKAEPVKAPEPVVNNNALFKKRPAGTASGSGSGGATGTSGRTGGNNNGDDASGVGDKGNPNGKLDAKEFYGKPGGGSTGVAFNVSGWTIGQRALDKDDSDESGRIVFQIKVDQGGDIVSVRVLETQVSPAVTDFYRRQVSRLRPIPKSQSVPDVATGTVVINVRTR